MTDWHAKLNTIWGKNLSGQRVTLAEALLGGQPPVKQASAQPPAKPRIGLKDGQFEELDDREVDYEFGSPNRYFGTHANLVPLVSAVQGQRPFYGARFYNQALPLTNPEAPLVQNLVDGDPEGRSFDEVLGTTAGAIRSKFAGRVLNVTPDAIELEGADGTPQVVELYNRFQFNRKTDLSNVPVVKLGDVVKPGQLLARSNYTDDQGTLAMGLNARVGVVPYLGHTMDDAMVISESLAKRLTSEQLIGHDLDFDRDMKGGKAHYAGIFPKKFINAQLDKLDDDGVVKPGQVVMSGDPLILATRPRTISSQAAQLGQLSKHMRNARSDAAVTWDHEDPGVVTDVAKVKGGVKVNVAFKSPAKVGDKAVYRSGQKGIISHIIPDEHMPRTLDGKPLEALLNQMGLPSRVNPSLPYELLLGKIARLTGKPYKLPSFNQPEEAWHDQVQAELDKHGVKAMEEVFDPKFNRKLDQPIMVGDAFLSKLHHTGESKMSARGQGSYTADFQPAHGGGATAKSKRLSGLETYGLLAAGAYGVVRDGATVRGTKADDYWSRIRQGHEAPEPGSPFVWQKFQTLLRGAGYATDDLPDGTQRLRMMTDRDLDKQRPLEVKTGDLVDLGTLEPVPGGLFDAALTGGNKWGSITLPFKVPNPAAHDMLRKLLGLTEKEFRAILAGQAELPERLRKVAMPMEAK